MVDQAQQPQEPQIPTQADLLGESQELQTQTHTLEVNPEELIAREQGWVPKEEWKGDPEDWRGAKEFNERGELFTRIKDQSRQLAEHRKALEFLTAQQQIQYQRGFQNAVKELQAQRAQAIDEGDHQAAAILSDKIVEAKQQVKAVEQVQAAPQGPSPTFMEWRGQENWYMVDKTMTRYADTVGLEYRDENPGSTEAQMLAYVSREVRRQFADKFQPKGPPSPDGVSRQESPRGRGEQGSASVRNAEAGMTDEQKSIMRTVLKVTPNLTKEQYMKQYLSQ